MIVMHPYNPNGTCQHCHKGDRKGKGVFEVTANHRPLALCHKCLANVTGLMADAREETMPLEFAANGR